MMSLASSLANGAVASVQLVCEEEEVEEGEQQFVKADARLSMMDGSGVIGGGGGGNSGK